MFDLSDPALREQYLLLLFATLPEHELVDLICTLEERQTFAETTQLRQTAVRALAALRSPQFTHDRKGGQYQLLGEAMPAGTLKGAANLAVYQDISAGPMRGQLFYRELDDFAKRMIPLSEHSEPETK